ncbi:MAG: DUF1636 family protein [Rhodobacteraceae bacterium]|nr:DUF1636 family protein [Paracoccaceae bacterium]
MSGLVATVCASCPAGEARLASALRAALVKAHLDVEVRETLCMSGCARPSALAFRAPGKMAYLFGEIGLDDLPDLLIFVRLYLASSDGDLEDARPLGGLRTKAVARIPG